MRQRVQFSFDVPFPNDGAALAASALTTLFHPASVDWEVGLQAVRLMTNPPSRQAAFPGASPDWLNSAAGTLAHALYFGFCEAQPRGLGEADMEAVSLEVSLPGVGDVVYAICDGEVSSRPLPKDFPSVPTVRFDAHEFWSVEVAATAAHLLIREFNLKPLAFGYAYTDPMFVDDPIGGGAALCTPDGVEYIRATQIAFDKLNDMLAEAGSDLPTP